MQVTDLTVEELKLLIKETVSETFQSLLIDNGLVNPDLGKQLRPEFAAQLREAIQKTHAGQRGQPAAEFAKELGLNWDEL